MKLNKLYPLAGCLHLTTNPGGISWKVPMEKWLGPYNARAEEWQQLAKLAAETKPEPNKLFCYSSSSQGPEGSILASLGVESGCIGTRTLHPEGDNPLPSGDIVIVMTKFGEDATFFIIP